MQKNNPFLISKASTVYTSFLKEMRILPNYTPLFLADFKGHILKGRKISSLLKNPFPTLAKLVTKDEYFEAQNLLYEYGVCACRAKDDPLCFLVISKCEYGFSRCIAASLSEKGCLKLDDYLLKLCSYKDYLDSFERLHYTSSYSLPLQKMIKSRISGASAVIEMANTKKTEMVEKSIVIGNFCQKLSAFLESNSSVPGTKVELLKDNLEKAALISQSFLKLCVSCSCLVLRKSKHNHITISAKAQNKNSIELVFSTNSKPNTKSNLYENTVLRALCACGYDCNVGDANGVYSIALKLNAPPKSDIVVKDAKEYERQLDIEFSLDLTKDIFFAVSNCVEQV